MKYIDTILNSLTMYKVVLYSLIILAVAAMMLGGLGLLSYNPLQMFISFVILFTTCYFSNLLFAKLLNAPTNSESSYITGVILFFILTPVTDSNGALTVFIAALIAMASKYIFAIKKKHIFNPAAFAAFTLGLIGNGSAEWWVGSTVLLPVMIILGILIVRKIRRFQMVFSFLALATLVIALMGIFVNKVALLDAVLEAFTSWPLIFFATVMLTEPMTSPSRNKLRIIYASIVAVLFGSQFTIGPLYSSPELALLIGNVFAYIVSPKQRLLLKLKEKRQLASGMFEYAFAPNQKLPFLPGQYLEWTLPHKKADIRGNRRFFTIASSPTEPDIKLGVRMQDTKGSSFKKALRDLKNDDVIAASQLAGDFTLPDDLNKKLVFIAGGIGVTPFRSMVQYFIDSKQKRDIIFLYTVPHPDELAYRDIFENAGKNLLMNYYYIITRPENAPADWTGKKGRISPEMVKELIPDFKERFFYLSGPNAMVESYKKLLKELGVPLTNIRTDYFPGF
jgi:ferredoxin-NADP reductase/Na+-translocating ferredoxin:NAD+ oxidoreductase RnfD subunit